MERRRIDNLVTGRYAKGVPDSLRADYEEMRKDPDLLKLNDEIALARAVLAHRTQMAQETGGAEGKTATELIQCADRIGQLVQRHADIQHSVDNCLTRAQAYAFIASVADTCRTIIEQYVPLERRSAAAEHLRKELVRYGA